MKIADLKGQSAHFIGKTRDGRFVIEDERGKILIARRLVSAKQAMVAPLYTVYSWLLSEGYQVDLQGALMYKVIPATPDNPTGEDVWSFRELALVCGAPLSLCRRPIPSAWVINPEGNQG